jgi:hypothetical protein
LNDPVLPDEVTEALAAAVAPRLPDETRAAHLRERVLERVRRDRPRFLTVRTADGTWVTIAPGVAVKHLQDDGTMQSFLLRLDAGARLAAHDHPICDEHCIVVEGSVRLGDVEVSRGDYHVAYAGSSHGELMSDRGAILYLRTASGTIPRI